jgi:signal transduction histidine kinase
VTGLAAIGRLASRIRRPATTIRWRLALLYGGLFLASGAGLLAITYTLVDHATVTSAGFFSVPARADPANYRPSPRPSFGPDRHVRLNLATLPPPLRKLLKSRAGKAVVQLVGRQQRVSDLHQLEIESVIALAIMAIISAALGWVIAGRVLRPLRTITATTQQISEANLHQRLAMAGPPDELTQLAGTIDGLLERMEGAFDAQRRFAANASHELRTPLTVARALLEMIITDPHATVDTFRETCRQVLQENQQQEQLIDALLTLARGHRGLDQHEPVDLTAITGGMLQAHQRAAAERDLHVDASLEPATLAGDARLIERLVANLVENTIRHNHPGGQIELWVRTQAGHAALTVTNTGPRVPADQIDRLLQPFQRLTQDRTGHNHGHGLGLSIVAAIAAAHDATLHARPALGGGLTIEILFPSSDHTIVDATSPVTTSPPADTDQTTPASPLHQPSHA